MRHFFGALDVKDLGHYDVILVAKSLGVLLKFKVDFFFRNLLWFFAGFWVSICHGFGEMCDKILGKSVAIGNNRMNAGKETNGCSGDAGNPRFGAVDSLIPNSIFVTGHK